MNDYHDSDDGGVAAWISRTLSRIAIGGVLIAAILSAGPAHANWAADYEAAQCRSAGGIYRDGRCIPSSEDNLPGSYFGLLLDNLTRDPAGKTATFFGTYEYLCSTKRFGPCTHNVEEWERRHGPR